MTEEEYIIATNRVKISTALTIIRDVLPGENYGISDNAINNLIIQLRFYENELFKSFNVEGEIYSESTHKI